MTFQVEISGYNLNCTLPKSYTRRNEIAQFAITNIQRAAVTALAACWQDRSVKGPKGRLRRPTVTLEACGFSLGVFSERWQDDFMQSCERLNIPYSEVFAAGMVAWNHIAESMPREEEVAAEMGNSDPLETGEE